MSTSVIVICLSGKLVSFSYFGLYRSSNQILSPKITDHFHLYLLSQWHGKCFGCQVAFSLDRTSRSEWVWLWDVYVPTFRMFTVYWLWDGVGK